MALSPGPLPKLDLDYHITSSDFNAYLKITLDIFIVACGQF